MKRRRGQNSGVSRVSRLRPGKEAALSRSESDQTRFVQIEKPVYGGNFLARDEGKAIFVPLVLPGEQARVRVIDDKRGYATAELEELAVSSAQRIAPACPHFGPCGGCQYQHADYKTQLQFKQAVLRETLERGGVVPPASIAVLAAEPWQYRNRIRLAFDTQGRPGYRGRRSHSVIPILECPIAAPLLVRAALAVAEIIRAVAPALRPSEMALCTDANEAALLLTLFVSRPAKVRFDDVAMELRKRIAELSGAELVLQTHENQPGRPLAQWGSPFFVYHAATSDYRVDHGAFFQVNRWLVDELVDRVTSGDEGALAWDLFAGVGLFARKLAESFGKVVAVESAPAATEALAANLQGTTGTAVRSSTLQFLRQHRQEVRPDLIVVDPPRTGLGADITQLIAEIKPPALTYVSCDPATLTRDLRALLAAGYAIQSLTLVDLFPQTFHLETVVRMRLN